MTSLSFWSSGSGSFRGSCVGAIPGVPEQNFLGDRGNVPTRKVENVPADGSQLHLNPGADGVAWLAALPLWIDLGGGWRAVHGGAVRSRRFAAGYA